MGIFHPKPKVERNAIEVGTRGEQFIISRLVACGYTVLVPIGHGIRYDLVIEDADGRFWKVQCKTGRRHHRENAISFNCYTVTAKGKMIPYNASQIDYFAVYYKELEKAYLIPFDHAGAKIGHLRLGENTGTRGRWGAIKDARFAADYEF